MKCLNCGNEVSGNNRYCPYCGYKMPVKKDRKNGSGGLVAIIIILVVLIMICACAYILLFESPENVKPVMETEPPVQTEQPLKTAEPTPAPTEEPTPVPTPEPTPVPVSKRGEFERQARMIEKYENDNMTDSMSQADMNHESGIIYAKWDELLNDVYQHLKNTMPTWEFKQLQSDEKRWVKEKEKAMESAAEEWDGGSMAPFAYSATGSRYTRQRCYYLISLVD